MRLYSTPATRRGPDRLTAHVKKKVPFALSAPPLGELSALDFDPVTPVSLLLDSSCCVGLGAVRVWCAPPGDKIHWGNVRTLQTGGDGGIRTHDRVSPITI